MVTYYFKIAWRNLIKNKGFTFINLIGLAAGFAITLLIIQYVRFETSYENTHPNSANIVRLTIDFMEGKTVTTQDSETYPAIGPKLINEVSSVEAYTRVYPIDEPNTLITVGEKQFILKDLFAVDPDFFKMFNYKLLYGNEQDLFKKPNEIVLTESLALQYFNRKDVVGETIVSPGQEGKMLLKIVGVTHDSPINTHLKFDMLVSYSTMYSDIEMQKRHKEKKDNWSGNNTYTYVKLKPNTDYTLFSSSLSDFSKRLIDEKKIKSERVIAQKIKDIHLHSSKTFEPDINGNYMSILFLLGVAFLVIISAFVNYINLATSRALDRAKEVGIKKVVGSSKGLLKFQFLLESFLITSIAGIIAILIIFFGKKTFLEITGLPETFTIFQNFSFWILLISFIIFGTFLSGLYPAFILSSFKPLSVLRGNFSTSNKGNFLRKGLVIFQFAITIILLIQTFTVNEQLDYMRTLDMGVKVNNTIVVNAPSQKSYQQKYASFKQDLLSNSTIKKVSLSHTVPGQTTNSLTTTSDIRIKGVTPDKYHNFYITFIDEEYVPLMGASLLAGTNFDKTTTRDKRYIIVNEEALKRWNIPTPEDAINKILTFWNNEWTIIGVVKNYHQESPKSPFLPMLHLYNNTFRSLATVQFVGGTPTEQISKIKETYNAVFPDAPFSYFFMDTEYDKQFRSDEQFKKVFIILTCFSILIACLGLLGLASFSVSKRRKEIGIRKVIGASTHNILILLSKDFLKTVMISVIIGLPITYLLINAWLDNFALRIELYWWLFVIPIILVFLLVIISISFKTVSIAISNPINSLKTE